MFGIVQHRVWISLCTFLLLLFCCNLESWPWLSIPYKNISYSYVIVASEVRLRWHPGNCGKEGLSDYHGKVAKLLDDSDTLHKLWTGSSGKAGSWHQLYSSYFFLSRPFGICLNSEFSPHKPDLFCWRLLVTFKAMTLPSLLKNISLYYG